MRVLITRPLEEAETLAAALDAQGIECMVEPLLAIRPLDTAELSLDGVQALLFTSANGVRAFASLEPRRDLPVYAIGEHSAEVARAAGFEKVESAGGAVEELARLVRTRVDPGKGTLLHGAGAVIKGDLAALLGPDGFTVRRIVLYEAAPATAFSGATVTALRDGTLDAVLFFSPRSAETFVSLAKSAGVDAACARLAAICLSPAVAGAAGTIRWRVVRIAARPEQSALLELVALPNDKDKVPEQADDKPEDKAAGDSLAQRAIRAFGGIRPMAAKLGVPVTTVQGWKERGHIPEARIPDVLAASATHGLGLTEAELRGEGEPPAAATSTAASAVSSGNGTPPSGPDKPAESAARPGAPDRPAPKLAKESAPAASLAGRRYVGLVPALWAASLAALVVAVAVSLPYWGPRLGIQPAAPLAPETPAAVTHLAQLDKSLAAVRKQLTALEGHLKAAPGGGDAGAAAALAAKQAQLADDLATAQKRLAALERLAGDLASRPEPRPGADPGEVAALEARVAALEQQSKKDAAAAARRAALALAVGQLQEALTRSAPYDKALTNVAALGGDDHEVAAAVETLKGRAAAGVPTVAELTQRFDAVSVAAARAAIAPARTDWVGQALSQLSRLVVIRRTSGDAGNGPQAVLARAESRLRSGDLAGTVAALDGLKDGPADAVKPWLADARARLAADRALAALAARAIDRLGEVRS
jgi:uroporphyrinogen-III synthase